MISVDPSDPENERNDTRPNREIIRGSDNWQIPNQKQDHFTPYIHTEQYLPS